MSKKNPEKPNSPVLIQGNEAIAEGALAAGCRFYAGYPITPATEILEYMALKMPKLGGIFIQMEDEIASLGAVLGASLAGKKAMTATSGPGFSLMQENIGFAVVGEIPCVIVNVMRGGPSTGTPTFPAQGDVMQSRWGTHGDHNIIVLAPSNVYECFYITIKAFNFSEKYRTPIILLSDEVVSHTREKFTIPPAEELEVIERPQPTVPPDWYKPYDFTGHSVAPMASFGKGYRYHVTGLIHDEYGFPTSRQDEIELFHNHMRRKINTNFEDIQIVNEYYTEDAEVCIITYGSVARSARHAVKEWRQAGYKVGLLQLITLFPFPRRKVEEILERVKTVLVPEMNWGQISREVKRVNQGQVKVITLNKVDGTLITPSEIANSIQGHI